ncbi:uncharacterized protein [Haliotis asinina]|uniref:uncharacterized protein n=1 Tax=Haliotis asinina TaxID=109174 RepID=UPI0035325820
MERADHNRMVPPEGADKYTDSIELSNACREFYQSRLKSAQSLKEKWGSDRRTVNISDSNGNEKKKSSIDIAMEKLRSEMASLMDQDLSLMKQLLTLNEEIEELKWRRRYCWSKSSFLNSSCDVTSTDWSQSDMSITKLGEDLPPKYPSPSSLSLSIDDSRGSFYDDADSARTLSREQLKGSMSKMVQKIQKLERDSYDSGINEGYTETSISVPQPLVTHL